MLCFSTKMSLFLQISHVFDFIFHLNLFFLGVENVFCHGHVDFSGINSWFPKISVDIYDFF